MFNLKGVHWYRSCTIKSSRKARRGGHFCTFGRYDCHLRQARLYDRQAENICVLIMSGSTNKSQK